MILKKMPKNKISIYIIIIIFACSSLFAKDHDFKIWVDQFKKNAIESGISKSVVDDFMYNVRFLPKVIEYDSYQPEFYEDTNNYISKRTSNNKVKKGLILY